MNQTKQMDRNKTIKEHTKIVACIREEKKRKKEENVDAKHTEKTNEWANNTSVGLNVCLLHWKRVVL